MFYDTHKCIKSRHDCTYSCAITTEQTNDYINKLTKHTNNLGK